MRDEVMYRQLGKILWDIGGVETGVGTACGLMASSPLLTAAERRFIEERMWPEERAHERIMARWGRAWYGPRPKRRLPYAAAVWRDLAAGVHLPETFRFAYAFATTHWNEINTLRSQRDVLPVLEAADPSMAADFRQILGEESGHVAWGAAVRARLEREAPRLSRIVERYFELTGAVYPAVINRAHGRVWQQLRRRQRRWVPPPISQSMIAPGSSDDWPREGGVITAGGAAGAAGAAAAGGLEGAGWGRGAGGGTTGGVSAGGGALAVPGAGACAGGGAWTAGSSGATAAGGGTWTAGGVWTAAAGGSA